MAGFLAAAILSGTAPVVANHDNDAASGDPDDGNHYVDRNSLTSSGDIASVWGVAELNRARDMSATFTGSGDVEIYDSTYGDVDWAGLTNCASGFNWITGNCDVFRVRFNQTRMAGQSLDRWWSLGCHELGHTAGLAHRVNSNDGNDNSCMRAEIWPRSFDTHDLDAINSSV